MTGLYLLLICTQACILLPTLHSCNPHPLWLLFLSTGIWHVHVIDQYAAVFYALSFYHFTRPTVCHIAAYTETCGVASLCQAIAFSYLRVGGRSDLFGQACLCRVCNLRAVQ